MPLTLRRLMRPALMVRVKMARGRMSAGSSVRRASLMMVHSSMLGHPRHVDDHSRCAIPVTSVNPSMNQSFDLSLASILTAVRSSVPCSGESRLSLQYSFKNSFITLSRLKSSSVASACWYAARKLLPASVRPPPLPCTPGAPSLTSIQPHHTDLISASAVQRGA